MKSVSDGGRPELRVRLAAEAASVPGARRFVTDGLVEWGREHLVDDAALCITEMAANSALHSGSPYMHIRLCDLEPAVRLSVEDDGALIPLPAVAPPPVQSQGTTGRGLAIVSVLAKSWGIEEHVDGRRIWAEIAGDGVEHDVRPPTVRYGEKAMPEPVALPTDWVTVRLPACPVQLGLQIDQRLDDLVRELQLIDSEDGPTPPRELGELIERLVTRPAFARHMGRRIALDAAAAGLEYVDIEMTLPREMGPMLRELLAADNLADEISETHQLLTLRSTPEMVSLRTWFTESIVGQAEKDADPVPYDEWVQANGEPG
ncbi:Histidine kinase-like ATPase domain-containing protein [Nocardioides sp. YR527]|uniref:ATP-binding protein n=1 Tax=Nocardioides sp. YR527 TaxID=1881028 RepID=UPI000884EAF7|nr:ATP-binding protein [Nocardioides sp. YR527]SDK85185.1 Histidine kinase-like ATPase domain-containing protein [Nocardioides sp. YR527]